jgi:hypothetical protein
VERALIIDLGKLRFSLLDLVQYRYKERQFFRKMPSCKLFTRLVSASSLVLFGLASSAMADITPVDPHALFATGGDATPIFGKTPIVFSNPDGTDQGGGIFVFQNETGLPLSEVDVAIDLSTVFFQNNFSLTQTIFVPPGSGQQASNGFSTQQGNCNGGALTTDTCLKLSFALDPGPLVLPLGNFVLDFDAKPNGVYGFVDELVATGQYNAENCGEACTGTTDNGTQRIGEWPNLTQAYVTPIVATPEPRQYAGLLAGIIALAIFLKRRGWAVTAEIRKIISRNRTLEARLSLS